MSWHTLTWDDADGVTPFIDALSAALEAHPAWEFVEETIERMTVEGSVDEASPTVWYDMMTYPIQVWRCLGSVNGSADFYLAFSRTIQGYPESDDEGEGGYLPVFSATGYDVSTHTASNVLGKATWQSVTLDADGYIEGVNGYPWIQPKVEQGGTTWGYWGSPGQEETPNGELTNITRGTQHVMALTSGRTPQFPTFRPGDAQMPTSQSKAMIRVTERGVFFAFHFQGDAHWKAAHYVGLYEHEGVPDELQQDVPLIQHGPDEYPWGVSGSSASLFEVAQLKHGRRNESSGIGQWFRSPSFYSFQYDSNLETSTEREKFPAPAVAPYVVVPVGITPTTESGFDMPAPLYAIPGIWVISGSDDIPTGWTNDGTTLINSPEGHECVIHSMAPGEWFVIDKELV